MQVRVLSGFAFVAILALLFLLAGWNTITGSAVRSCPVGYASAGGYCVEKACQNKAVRCMRQGNLVKRPDCVCMTYMGRHMCGIKGGEKTAIKSARCTRRGQMNSICGAYDSNLHRCVNY